MGRLTWLTPYVDAWQKKTGTPPNHGRLARELGTVKRALKARGLTKGQAERQMLRHWKEYVGQTPAKYLSPTRFRETFNGHDPNLRHRLETDKQLDKQNKAKERKAGRREPTVTPDLFNLFPQGPS